MPRYILAHDQTYYRQISARAPRRAKRKAAARNRALTSLIGEGLRWLVGDRRKTRKTERVVPRLSTVTGPPPPGIDIPDSAALQEMDDLEYVERLKNGFK